jgi:hypothetical protein
MGKVHAHGPIVMRLAHALRTGHTMDALSDAGAAAGLSHLGAASWQRLAVPPALVAWCVHA